MAFEDDRAVANAGLALVGLLNEKLTVEELSVPFSIHIGAYGNAQGADIPAVQINVLGGTTPPLFPGTSEPVNYLITNISSSPACVNQVLTSVNAFTT
jgi:hypothetical protein